MFFLLNDKEKFENDGARSDNSFERVQFHLNQPLVARGETPFIKSTVYGVMA